LVLIRSVHNARCEQNCLQKGLYKLFILAGSSYRQEAREHLEPKGCCQNTVFNSSQGGIINPIVASPEGFAPKRDNRF
jgi:hypothetical protein